MIETGTVSMDVPNILEITDFSESVENFRSSPGAQDACKSMDTNVCLQFQSVSQTVSKSVLFRGVLRVLISSVFFSGEPPVHWESRADPGQTSCPEGTTPCCLLIGWEVPPPAGLLARVPGILRGLQAEAGSSPVSLTLGMSASEFSQGG